MLVEANCFLTTISLPEEPNIFWKFRDVFRADQCAYRKIYWYEKFFGNRIRLWQVNNLGRSSTKDDSVVMIFKGELDIDLVKLAIAAKNHKCWLTGVRWEIYSDFSCQHLEAMGRFDHMDLLPSDQKKLRKILEQGKTNIDSDVMSWDYDCLIATHKCPGCGSIYGKDVVLFIPTLMECKKCGYYDKNKSGLFVHSHYQRMVSSLIKMVVRNDSTIFEVSGGNGDKVSLMRLYLSLLPTSLICWIIGVYFGGQPLKSRGLPMGELGYEFSPQEIYDCMDKSIFFLLEKDIFRKQFVEFFEEEYELRRERLEAGIIPDKSINAFPSEEMLIQWMMRNLIEERNQFIQSVEMASNLRHWFFDVSPDEYDQEEISERLKEIVDSLKYFPDYLEQILAKLWKEDQKENQKENLP